MMNDNIQMIFVGKDMLFEEVQKRDFDISVIFTEEGKSIVWRLLRKIYCSQKINNIIKLPHKEIWLPNLNGYVTDPKTEYYFVFTNATLYPFSPDDLNCLHKHSNVHLIMLWGDPFDSIYSEQGRYYYANVKFDHIFTINPVDSAERGFIYTFLPYNYKKREESISVKNDIYFAGAAKDRLDYLLKIYEKLSSAGISANFRITGVEKQKQRYSEKIIYNKQIPYRRILEHVQSSNCILEILALGQTGATLRYYEAVINNKKLLTTNKNVVNLPFYNPNYIHIFESAEDIDPQWVKNQENIDYHYDGQFSLAHFAKQIIDIDLKHNK